MDEIIKRYFQIVARINQDPERVSEEDLMFFLTNSPKIDDNKMREFIAAGKEGTYEQYRDAVVEATRKLQTEPIYKQKLLDGVTSAKGQQLSEDLSAGINLVLGASDIAASINQIRQANAATRKSRRPGRPAIPQRDLFLQNALMESEQPTMDAERALAPARAEIYDTYLGDIQGAKTASTGQSGAYGAYRQLASNRRNRAAMELAPIADSIRAREQARRDNLLGMRMGETQQMFENQASMYPYDLDLYKTEQNAAASLGSTGRQNLRDSLYNLGGQASNFLGQNYSRRRYNSLYNQAQAAGLNPDNVVKVRENLDGYVAPDYNSAAYWNQMY